MCRPPPQPASNPGLWAGCPRLPGARAPHPWLLQGGHQPIPALRTLSTWPGRSQRGTLAVPIRSKRHLHQLHAIRQTLHLNKEAANTKGVGRLGTRAGVLGSPSLLEQLPPPLPSEQRVFWNVGRTWTSPLSAAGAPVGTWSAQPCPSSSGRVPGRQPDARALSGHLASLCLGPAVLWHPRARVGSPRPRSAPRTRRKGSQGQERCHTHR